MKIVGIDPGSVSGALAMVNGGSTTVVDIPHIEGQIDGHWLAQSLRQLKPDFVVIERVHSMPKQGVSSTFKFGTAYGIIQGVVMALAIPFTFVSPQVWKGHFTLAGKDDDAVRNAAMRRYPFAAAHMTLKKHHNKASALMIATWYQETRP